MRSEKDLSDARAQISDDQQTIAQLKDQIEDYRRGLLRLQSEADHKEKDLKSELHDR